MSDKTHITLPVYRNHTASLEDRCADLLGRLTLDEKISLMTTRQSAVPRLGIRECSVGGEAAHGLQVRDGQSTVFPQTIGLSQTWDEELMKSVGEVVGTQARAWYERRGSVGGLMLWAPTVDMERDPRWGRNEEAYGEDPLLAGRLAGAYVRGMQGDDRHYLRCLPALKHFYGNNNEADRVRGSSVIDERNAREYYLAVYEHLIRHAKVHSFMTAYNAINGVPAMVHPHIEKVVRGEWGFEGFVVCDGGAFKLLCNEHRWGRKPEEAVAATVRAGVDCVTDDPRFVMRAIRRALARGLLVEADLDRAIGRVMRMRLRLGEFDPPSVQPWAETGFAEIHSIRSRQLAFKAAQKSIVLLKNRNGTLPLKDDGSSRFAALGPLAAEWYKDWYSGNPSHAVSPLEALAARLGPERVLFADGDDVVAFRDAKSGFCAAPAGWDTGRLKVDAGYSVEASRMRRRDWGWGNTTFLSNSHNAYLTSGPEGLGADSPRVWGWVVRQRFSVIEQPEGGVGLFEATGLPIVKDKRSFLRGGKRRAKPWRFTIDVAEDGNERALHIASRAETALIFVGNHPLLVAKEEIDRTELRLAPRQESLVRSVCSTHANTVLVIVGSYPFELGDLADLPGAIVFMPHGGEEGGRALVSTLFGDFSPAGRLSQTWYRSVDQLGSVLDYDVRRSRRTYRFRADDTACCFGHGLAYVDFAYSALTVSDLPKEPTVWSPAGAPESNAPVLRFNVTNEGTREAEEVIQVYVRVPEASGGSRTVLADFFRAKFAAREQRSFERCIDVQSLAQWDPALSRWYLQPGHYEILVGASSKDTRLSVSFEVEGPHRPVRNFDQYVPATSFDECSSYDSGITLACSVDGVEHVSVRAGAASAQGAWIMFRNVDVSCASDSVLFEATVSRSEHGARRKINRGSISLHLGSPETAALCAIDRASNPVGGTKNSSTLLLRAPAHIAPGTHDLYVRFHGSFALRGLRILR